MGREECQKGLKNTDLETSLKNSIINPNLAMAYLVGSLCYNNPKHELAKERAAGLDIARTQIRLYYLKL